MKSPHAKIGTRGRHWIIEGYKHWLASHDAVLVGQYNVGSSTKPY